MGVDDGALVLVLVELELIDKSLLLNDEVWTTGSKVDTTLLSVGLLIVCNGDGIGDDDS